MKTLFLLGLILKGICAFFGVFQIVRLCVSPGFAQFYFEGKRRDERILLNNVIFLVASWGVFYLLGLMGINFL